MANNEQAARIGRAAKALGVDESLLMRLVETGAFSVNYLALMSDSTNRRLPAGPDLGTEAGESS